MDISLRFRRGLFCAAAVLPLCAQPFYIGVKGGVLLSADSRTSSSSGRQGRTDSSMLLRRYAVGPSFEIALPACLRLETGLLYRRYDSTSVTNFADISISTLYVRDNRWEVPLVLRRELSRSAAQPFAGAGGVWSRSSLHTRVETLSGLVQPPTTNVYSLSNSDNLFGWTGSAGIRFRLPVGVKITPEIRYTRWTAQRLLPSQNQVDFFLGIGF
jgi:opacity protein-like surface antigen